MKRYAVVIGILGLWLIAAGIINLGTPRNVFNDWIVGVIVGICGFNLAYRVRGAGIVAGILGFWMIVSAFIPGLTHVPGARLNDIFVGIILAFTGRIAIHYIVTTEHIRRAA